MAIAANQFAFSDFLIYSCLRCQSQPGKRPYFFSPYMVIFHYVQGKFLFAITAQLIKLLSINVIVTIFRSGLKRSKVFGRFFTWISLPPLPPAFPEFLRVFL